MVRQSIEIVREIFVHSRLIRGFKGDGHPDDYLCYMKDLNKPWILIPVSSKSFEKCGSCGRLNICKWTVMEAAIL